MQRFVTYRRVSTKEQGRSGLGLEAQSRDIAVYLARYAEEPWEVIGEFTEVDSGANADRPSWLRPRRWRRGRRPRSWWRSSTASLVTLHSSQG